MTTENAAKFRYRRGAFHGAILALSPTHAQTCEQGKCVCAPDAFKRAVEIARSIQP